MPNNFEVPKTSYREISTKKVSFSPPNIILRALTGNVVKSHHSAEKRKALILQKKKTYLYLPLLDKTTYEPNFRKTSFNGFWGFSGVPLMIGYLTKHFIEIIAP